MKVIADSITRPGGRKFNEDNTRYGVSGSCGCFLVADGLGGHRGGDLASKTACDSFYEAFDESPGATLEKLKNYLSVSASAMDALKEEIGFNSAAKTTLVALLVSSGFAVWAHIGDSRLYKFSEGRLVQQTKDHSIPQRLVDVGEITYDQIRRHEDRNRLLKAFDGSENCQFEYSNSRVAINAGDAFLLCTDGFWDYVNEVEMEDSLQEAADPKTWLELMEQILLARAEANHDNYTALAVMIK